MQKVAYFLCHLLHGPQFGLDCWVALWDQKRKEVAWAMSPRAACARKIEKTLQKGGTPLCVQKAMGSESGRICLPDSCCRRCRIPSLSKRDNAMVLVLKAGELVFGMFGVSGRFFETNMTSIQTFLDHLAGIVSFELLRQDEFGGYGGFTVT